MYKICVLVFLLFFSVCSYSQVGIKGQVLYNSDLGFCGGSDVVALFDLNRVIKFYPSLDFWYNGGQADQFYNGYYNVACKWYCIYELSLNADLAFILLQKPLPIYLGYGVAPVVITNENWNSFFSGYTGVNACFNIFAGVMIPFGKTHTGMIEIRGQLGKPYCLLKVSLGTIFKRQPPED
jgi:hypothetical protein